MSGLTGLWRLSGAPADGGDLEGPLRALAHRGPDGCGRWVHGPVGLGHRLLHTTPESHVERLPLVRRTDLGPIALTADARLDNRAELAQGLGLSSGEAAALPDSELLLRAYLRWDEHCVERLIGDFAFAIWDGRTRRLVCARDHFGVKPFYYYHRSGHLFCFSSEIKGLLPVAGVARRLNEVRIADYLVPLLEDQEITFYQDIRRLPPAHVMVVTEQSLRQRRYWALDPAREIRLASDEEYAAAFRERFLEAVRCRLRSASPVGSMLSGGLDSSSIVCVAQALLPAGSEPLRTFSAIFGPADGSDERGFIEAVLAAVRVCPHLVPAGGANALDDLAEHLAAEDGPFQAPNLFLHWALYRAARAAGVRCLLDGFDGDIVVSHGIARLAELFRSLRWLALAREVRGLAAHFQRPARAILLRHAVGPHLPALVARVLGPLRRRITNNPPLGFNLLNPAFARQVGVAQRVASSGQGQRVAPRSARTSHHRGLTHGLIPLTLEAADLAAAQAGIEPRYPFFDRRLAEFCLALPADQKLRRGWSRWVLGNALAGLLPPAIRWRGGKADLSHQFVRGLMQGNLHARIEHILGNPGSLRPYVNLAAIRAQLDRGGVGPGAPELVALWKIVALSLWLNNRGRAFPPGAGDSADPGARTSSVNKEDNDVERSSQSTAAAP